MTPRELSRYLNALNDKNDFDLAWEWCGNYDEPQVRIFEEAEDHELAGGYMNDELLDRIKKALPAWRLEDVEV